jgi:hypothetical protein
MLPGCGLLPESVKGREMTPMQLLVKMASLPWIASPLM